MGTGQEENNSRKNPISTPSASSSTLSPLAPPFSVDCRQPYRYTLASTPVVAEFNGDRSKNSSSSWIGPSSSLSSSKDAKKCQLPGTGKTMLAKAIANEAGASFINASTHKPDPTQSTQLLYALCKINKIRKMVRVMELMVSSGNTSDTSTYTFLVNQLCKRGNVGYAMQMVDKMDDYGCPPTTVTYNSLIMGLCIHGNFHQSLQLMEKLMHRGLIPNVFTFSFLLEAAYKEKGADEAVRLLDEIIAKGGKPNLVSYNVLLTGFSKEGRLEDATKFFRVLPSKGFKPNVVSYNILLRSLCYDGRWEEAEELLDEMNSNDCSLKSGEVWMVIVQKLFDEMPKRDVFPWAILINGHEKIDSDIHGARELFNNVREKNVLIFDLGGGYIALPLAEIPRPVTTVTTRPSILALTNYLYNVLVHLEEGFGVILPSKRSLPKPPWSYLKSSFCRTPSVTTSSRPSPKPPD